MRNGERDTEEVPIIIGKEKYRPLKSGIYHARLISREDYSGKYQEAYRLCFQIVKGDYAGRFINGLINKTESGQKGKLWQLYRAIKGVSLRCGDPMFLSDLIDGECCINVEQRGHSNAITEYICPKEFKDLGKSNV